MPSAVKVPKVLLKLAKKERISNVKLPVYKLRGQEGSRKAECHACRRTKIIPNTRRVFEDYSSICDDCYAGGGDNIVMSGVDKTQVAVWVSAHCPGGAEDMPSQTHSIRKAFLGEEEW
jgi:hypothetical protein